VNVVIRADASSRIGYGHIMRCLTLADELKKHASYASFICKSEQGNLIGFIRESGFKVYELPTELDPIQDSEYTKNLLENKIGYPDYLIVDHYGLDLSWEEHLKPDVGKIMVIDDLVNRKHSCDIILNQNYGVKAQEYDGLIPPECKKLIGSSYVLLRDQFKEIRKEIPRHSGEVKKVFIFFGGADLTNETKKAIEAMMLLNRSTISLIVQIADSNPYQKEIAKLCASLPNAILYQQVYDIAPLMAEADLAIGAGGSNTWERCCLGLPSIVMILAENQRPIVEKLSREGIVVNLGWFREVTPSSIAAIMNNLISDRETLRSMSVKAMEIVDGEGANRVIEEILN
jgi:UDP-2,4-diacetamido-2,4,6-trideoxy-beta-L-altropyranose hydrolase